MQVFMTLLVLAIWLWIGAYGFMASKRKNQKLITATWALLIIVVAAYIVSTLVI